MTEFSAFEIDILNQEYSFPVDFYPSLMNLLIIAKAIPIKAKPPTSEIISPEA